MGSTNTISEKRGILSNIKSKIIIKEIFKNIKEIKLLKIIRHNKKLHSQLNKDMPVMTRADIGEHKIEKSWLYDNLKEIYKIKKNVSKKKRYEIDEEDINKFVKKLKENNIEYDNLCCCLNKKHVIGYSLNGENFIYFGSELGVKYADLTYEKIEKKESFLNDFDEFKKKSEKIIEYKNTNEFKKKIVCKLCNFSVQ